MSLGKVSIAIEAAMAGFESDMGRAQRLLEKETKRMQKDLDSYQAKAKLVGAAVGAAIVSGLGLVAAATKRAINEMDDLSKTAQRVGLPTEEVSALAYAADLSDVNIEQLTTGLVKLTKNMSDAAQGTGEAQKGFKALGVDVKNADGSLKSSGQVLSEIAGKFAGYKDGAEKTALAVNLFGKSGAELIPLLNSGADGLAQMTEEAKGLGITFSGDTGKQAEAFNDNLTRMQAIAKGLWTQIAAQLLPMLVNLSDRFFSAGKGAQTLGYMVSAAVTGIKLLTSAGVLVVGVFKTLGEALGGVAATAVQLLTGDFKGAVQTFGQYQTDVMKNIGGTIGTIQDIWKDQAAEIKADAPQTSEGISAPVLQAEDKVKKSGKRIVDEAARIYKQVEDKIAQIKRDIDTFGMTPDQVQMYDLKSAGATPEQLGRAGDALGQLSTLQSDKDLYDESIKQEADRAKSIRDVTQAYADEIAMLGMSRDEQERYIATVRAGVDANSAAGQKIIDLVAQSQQLRKARAWMDDLADSTYNFFAGVLDYTKGAKEAFGDFVDSIRQMAIRLLAEAALQQLGNYLKSLGENGNSGGTGSSASGGTSNAGFWTGLISAIGSAFGGGRAVGGSTRAGVFYEVNENGPELYSTGGRTFLMSGGQDGHVTPLSASAAQPQRPMTVIAVYSEEEAQRQALAAMKSPGGERATIVHFQRNRKNMGIS